MAANRVDPTTSPGWAILEHVVQDLHDAARSAGGTREFYRELVERAADATGASGGAAWEVAEGSEPRLIVQWTAAHSPLDSLALPARDRRAEMVQRLAASGQPAVEQTDGTAALIIPVEIPAGSPAACIELWVAPEANSLVRQGWVEFGSALAGVAADFHAYHALRRSQTPDALNRNTFELVARLERARDLKCAAYEIANGGRRAADCDRLSVVVRRGRRMKLLAVSGVDTTDPRGEFARRIERLAEAAAQWGEPLEYGPGADADLPADVQTALDQHVDDAHCRQLACVAMDFSADQAESTSEKRGKARRGLADAVFVAEQFDVSRAGLREKVQELSYLCEPALARAVELDWAPTRIMLRGAQAAAAWRKPEVAMRRVAWMGVAAAVVAAFALVPCDYDVEAPAHLRTAVERDVFATATGTVAKLHARHGMQVAKGDVLVELRDPELELKLQQATGQLEATQKRLDALAVARTERRAREQDPAVDALPLSAEQQQLEEQAASLRRQRELLEAHRGDLSIRSPIDGVVLTRQVQTLLESRPVERGQVLLTVADPASGWELAADVPQRRMGAVVEAQAHSDAPLAVSYRLAGEVGAEHAGRVTEVSSAVPIDAERLRDDAAPVEVRIAALGETPAAARPGMSATVQIHCGRKPLGYVWLHDAAATVYRWLTF